MDSCKPFDEAIFGLMKIIEELKMIYFSMSSFHSLDCTDQFSTNGLNDSLSPNNDELSEISLNLQKMADDINKMKILCDPFEKNYEIDEEIRKKVSIIIEKQKEIEDLVKCLIKKTTNE